MSIKSLLLLFSFCLPFSLLLGQSQNYTITHNNLTREYSLYVPAIYDSTQSVPLLFNLHGYSSNNLQQEFYGDFRAIADTAGFIIVHPNGTEDLNGNRFWNVGFFPSNVDDVDFIETLIDSLSLQYNIDANRIYSTGMSNGGFMSYELACQTSRFAAIASVTGSMTSSTVGNCQPAYPVPVMQIHGTNDGTVAYEGGGIFQHIDSVVTYWVNQNNCPNSPTITAIPDIDTTDGANAERWVFPPGDNNAQVELIKVFDGAHTWPGAIFAIGVTCMDFSASVEIWRFFSQYQLPSTNTNTTAIENNNKLSIYPNPTNSLVSVKLPQELEGEKLIQLFSLQGQIIKSYPTSDYFFQLDISDVTAGNYLLKVSDGHKIHSQLINKY